MDSKKTEEKHGIITGIKDMLLSIKVSYLQRDNKVSELLCDLIMALVAFLFSGTHVALGVCSLGISLLCVARRRVIPVFLGCAAGSLTLLSGSIGYLIIYSGILLLRIFCSMPIKNRHLLPFCRFFFCEAPQIRIAISCLAGFGAGLYELWISDFAYYAVLFAIGSVAFSIIGAFLMLGIYESGFSLVSFLKREKVLKFRKVNLFSVYTHLSFIFFCVSLVFSVKGYSLFGLNVGFVALASICCLVSSKVDSVCGGLVGIIGGLLIKPIYAPSFLFLGVLPGIVTPLGEIYSLFFAVFLSVIYASLVGSVSGFLSVMPPSVISALLIWPLLRGRREDRKLEAFVDSEKESQGKAENSFRQYPQDTSFGRLDKLSSVFSDLSQVFYTISNTTRRPAISEYFSACDSICNRWCKKCSSRDECWESGERSAFKAMQSISERLYKRGVTDDRCIPRTLADKCEHIDEIVEQIRISCAALTREKQKGDKSELIAFDYEMIAKLLKESSKNDMLDCRKDMKLSCKLTEILKTDFGISDARVSVSGSRNKRISVRLENTDMLFDSEKEICTRFSEICGVEIGKMSIANTNDSGTVTLETLPICNVSFAYAASPASDSEVSGDNISSFKNSDGFYYAVLSDGMGSGETAAFTSNFSNLFLEKMLSAGMSKNTSIKMLNNFLRYKGCECSSTIDILEIDTLTGKASFVKSGAAPSFIKRGDNVFRIRSKTMPIGLLKSVDAEKIDFSIRARDIIIMFSDGVSQSPENEPWFLSAVSDISDTDTAKDVANSLIKTAKENIKKADDITVGIIKISALSKIGEIDKGSFVDIKSENGAC